MGRIITSGEENRPRIQCHNCKNENIIDIRSWNKDIARVGEIKCKQCGKSMFVALLILADINVQALGNNVQAIVDLMGSVNTLRQGKEEPKTELDN